MAIRYIYIDDDSMSISTETAKGLSIRPDELTVTPIQPETWEDQIKYLVYHQDEIDGLLLDWNLTNVNESGKRPNFNVEALAQQLRGMVIEKIIKDNEPGMVIEANGIKKDFPIILCSAKFSLVQNYEREFTSHDLFDAIYEKDSFHERQNQVINEMVDFAKSYQIIRNSTLVADDHRQSAMAILSIDNLEMVDSRVGEHLVTLISKKEPIHEIARFLFSKVINTTGLLINEDVLAARMGVNRASEDWQRFLEIIKPVKYTGAFSTAWNNWWMVKLESWWYENFNESLGTQTAFRRVEMINNKFGLSMSAAKKSEKSKSEFYWVICKETHVPIAIEDAVMAVAPIDKAEWEEDQYYSIECALRTESSKIHSFERDRVEKLKSMFTKVRVKS